MPKTFAASSKPIVSIPKSITPRKGRIQEQVAQLKDIKAKFPARWFALKDELTRMEADFVTLEEYRAICRRHREDDLDRQTLLAGFLHDLGISLNHKDDPRLRFAYVLKPEWVTRGIYALLHAFLRNRGPVSAVAGGGPGFERLLRRGSRFPSGPHGEIWAQLCPGRPPEYCF
jgi:hypothetical protein